MQSSKYIAIVITTIAVIWILSGLLFSGSTPPEENTAPTESKKIVDVRIRQSTAEFFTDNLMVTGRSRPSRTVEIKTETSGALLHILKEEGQKIEDQEVLAELEIRDREAKMRDAKQRVNQRSIEYNAAKKLENKGFNSKVRLAQTLADLENAKAELKDAQIDLENTKIKAPFDGIISEQNVEVGDYLDIGEALFTVVDLDPIEFVGFVPERHLQNIKMGSTARVEFLNGEKLEGTVSYIAPTANDETRTFRVVVSAQNSDFSTKAGLTARIYIPTPRKKAHKISPSILSLNDAGEIGVKTINADNKVEFKAIKILTDKPDGMWITGLSETIRIITVGQDFVVEGQSVNPILSSDEGLL